MVVNELRALCSPLKNIDGVEAFIVHISRKSLNGPRSLDRIYVQMPGHMILKSEGFDESEQEGIMRYIDSNMPVLVDMALERTESLAEAL